MCNKIVFDKKEYFWKKKTNIDNNNSILGVRITTPPQDICSVGPNKCLKDSSHTKLLRELLNPPFLFVICTSFM